MLYKEYNLNLIDLNKLLSEKIELNISNFIYDNNLTLSLSSRDFNYICKHFVLNEILLSLEENYNNIIIFNSSFEVKYLNNNFNKEELIIYLSELIKKSSKVFNFILFEYQNSNLFVDVNLLYKLKTLSEKRKKINYNKIKKFCQDNKLKHLHDKLENHVKTKMILHK